MKKKNHHYYYFPQTICTLFLYNKTAENVIAAARLETDSTSNSSDLQSLDHLFKIKVLIIFIFFFYKNLL